MEPQRLPDIHFEAPVLDVPDPPPGTPYAEIDDFHDAELLRVNGITPDREGVLDALRTRDGLLRAAAAHTAGHLGLTEAVPLLEPMLASGDETAVEAAYALTRLGDDQAGRPALERLVRDGGPVDLSRPRAAGYLARLGDRSGRPAIEDGLRSDHVPIRMTAARQLHAFAAPDLFRDALADPSTDVQWQALVQLRHLELTPEMRDVLRDYARTAADDNLRRIARELVG
ncbi:HEAT repeat domain-containing protein [Actinoplanes subtropicus]|uniref:HEAT repeat domain-containing protein n=1 Tax=Actinoplanes subtropicus TaxID=543632 RepID=UPI0004C46C0F|nr:HEAT repeat domain-containing protein [Actinoplanes subtropicus]